MIDCFAWCIGRNQGALELIERTDGRAIESEVLGCWLRAVGVGQDTRVRLATIQETTALFPTAEEAERQAKEAALDRSKPEVLLGLLRHLSHRVPSGLRLRLDDSDLSAAKAIERRADLVAVGRRPSGHGTGRVATGPRAR